MPMPRFKRLKQGDEDEDGEEGEEEVIRIPCKEDPDCDPFFESRKFFRAFDQGFTGNTYAKNFSNCAYNSITWVFKEIPTYKVKLYYGNY